MFDSAKCGMSKLIMFMAARHQEDGLYLYPSYRLNKRDSQNLLQARIRRMYSVYCAVLYIE